MLKMDFGIHADVENAYNFNDIASSLSKEYMVLHKKRLEIAITNGVNLRCFGFPVGNGLKATDQSVQDTFLPGRLTRSAFCIIPNIFLSLIRR
jgi:hypothetical protein